VYKEEKKKKRRRMGIVLSILNVVLGGNSSNDLNVLNEPDNLNVPDNSNFSDDLIPLGEDCWEKIFAIVADDSQMGLYINKLSNRVYKEVFYKNLGIDDTSATLLYTSKQIPMLDMLRNLIKKKGITDTYIEYCDITKIINDLFGKDELERLNELQGMYSVRDNFCADVYKNKHLFMLPDSYRIGKHVMRIKRKYINMIIRNRIHRNKIGY